MSTTIFGWTTALTLWRLIAAKLIAYPYGVATPNLSLSTCALRGRDPRSLEWTRFTVRDLAYHDICPVPSWLHVRADITEEERNAIVAWAHNEAALGYEIAKPFDVMLRNSAKRGGYPRRKKGANAAEPRLFRPHIATNTQPDGAFCLLWDDTYVVTPEYLYVQMAAVLKDPVQIAVLGCELTGGYALLPLGLVSLKKQQKGHGKDNPLVIGFSELLEADGYVERAPLTTVERLRRFIDALPPHTYGATRAKEALALVKDGSRSPMETVSSIQLRLSRSRGGFGAGDALFNQRIDIKPKWRGILKKDYLLVDELFGPNPPERSAEAAQGARSHARKPKTVGVEYQGGYHATDWQMTADNQRRFALEEESLVIYFVTGKDFLDERVWNIIGERIAHDTGHNYGDPSEAMLRKRAAVHAMLADPNLLRF